MGKYLYVWLEVWNKNNHKKKNPFSKKKQKKTTKTNKKTKTPPPEKQTNWDMVVIVKFSPFIWVRVTY